MWKQVVASPFLELLQKIRTPIGTIDLQAVAENRVRTIGRKCLHQPIADTLEIVLHRSSVVVIDNKAFGAHGRSLHLHTRAAGNKENNLSRATRVRKRHPSIMNLRESLIFALWSATVGRSQESSDQSLTGR